jgi:hypothetical protein
MRICSVWFPALVLATVAIGGGCTDRAGTGSPAESGVTIPLTQQANGKVYRLSAMFEITSPDGVVHRVDGTVHDPSVTVEVAPGNNKVELLDGWTLSRSTDGGMTFAPVSASLATPNPFDLFVPPNQVESFAFTFLVRDPNAQLQITFGVVDPPRQLSASLFVTGGFGDFAAYTFTDLGIAIYFLAFTQTSVEADGTHDLQINALLDSLEFFNDQPGLVTPLGNDFAGASLGLTTRIHPDGSQDFSGSDQAFGPPEITFGTGQARLTADSDGFPEDISFTAFGMPFELSLNGAVILTGRASLSVNVP